jgi:uncharacterized protein involved in outer membrane biogenesis
LIQSDSPPEQTLAEDAAPLKSGFATPQIIRKFMAMWLAFIVILVGVALLVDIDWAKPYCQAALTQMFHRKVRIGHLSWSFGLNGLEVDTTKLAVFEKDGSPFLIAGNSEIGIGILPLFTKRMVISHLNFVQPEIWAVRTSQAVWNFNDLLEFGPDIRYLQVQNGKMHLIDRIPNKVEAWKVVDLNEVKLKFVWPHKSKKTPFYLAFKLPKKGYTTSFDLSGIGSGELQNWQDNKYTFKATVSRANPEDMMPFLRAVSDRPLSTTEGGRKFEQLQGLFDFKIEGGGILSKGITADVSAEAQKFSFDAPVIGTIKAPEATTTAKIRIDTKNLEWKDMVTKLANVELTSHGTVSDWSQKLPLYSANFDSHIKDLGDVSRLVTKESTPNSYVDPANLSGSAEVGIKIVGPSDNPKLTTDVKSEGLPVEDFISRLPKELAPALCLLGLSKTSQVKGEIKMIPDERVDITEGSIPVAGGVIHTEGSANLKTDEGKFSFHTDNLSLAKAEQALYQSKPAMKELARLVFMTPKQRLNLDGLVDVNGVFEKLKDNGHNTSGTADFKNAEFSLSDGSLTARHMNGRLKWNNDMVTIERLAGTIGDGRFDLSGTASVRGTPSVDLKIHSDHLDLNQLNTLLKVLKVHVPLLTEHQLRGRVHELSLNVSGPRTYPNIYFKTTPEDLCYQPVGMSKPLRAKSGTIIYDHDVLTLQDVGFVTHNDKVVTSFAIEQLSTNARVNTAIKVKSAGIDLSDVDFYLASSVMPKPLKKLYTDFLKSYQLSKVHGRVYGDATCEMKNDKPNLAGIISLINIGAKFGEHHLPIEHVAGTLTASGSQLTLQDLSGALRNSHFNLNGHVENYQSDTPNLKTELIASLDSKEILELIPELTDQFKKWKLTITSSGPLALRARVNGNARASDVIFSVSSSASNRLVVSSPLGKLHQPLDEPMKIEGNLAITTNSMKVSSASVSIGDSQLQAEGAVAWVFKDRDRKDLDLPRSTLSGTLKSPHPVPAKRLIALLEPALAKDVGGTVSGALNLGGTAFQPKAAGKIVFTKIAIPSFDVRDLSGFVNLAELSGSDQKAEIDFSEVQIGQIPVHKIRADIKLDADEQQLKQPKVQITNGRASLAGGAMELTGCLDMNEHKLSLRTTLVKAQANHLTEQLFGHPGELTGTVDADVKFETEGNDYKDALANLHGNGVVTVHDGIVTRFSQLQNKITQANLLHQGLFGFNLNNLLQSTVPVRTGRFKDMVSEFRLSKNVLYVDELTYNGDDMRLWGAGKANLNRNTLDIEIAGKIPRVTSSVFGSGTIGEMSKAMTIQKIMNKVTMHQLENLPSLPVLGDIASDKPRAFAFKINSPLDKPKAVGQSIEKSFHWLPSKPRASAHPLPGLAPG